MEALLCLHESALLTQRDREAGSWKGGESCMRCSLLQAPCPPCRCCLRRTARGATPVALTRPRLLARPPRAPAHAGAKKHSTQDKRWGREPKVLDADEDETLATIAHLYASKERNPDGLRNERINKKDFWRIFGEVIMMRQQLEVSSPPRELLHVSCRIRQKSFKAG